MGSLLRAFVFVAAFWSARGVAAPQNPADAPSFRVETTLVRLDIQVEEGDHLLRGLHREDFVVYDEGRAQPVLHFVTDSAPVDIVLLVDISESMNSLVEDVSETALSAITALQPADRLALMSFDTKGRLLVPFTADHRSILKPLGTLTLHTFTGGTNLYRALRDACRYFQSSKHESREPWGRNRRVVLMLTDGIGGAAGKLEAPTLRDLWEADAVVDVMIVDPSLAFLQWRPAYTPQDLRRIAPETGGIVVFTRDVKGTLRSMLERCRTRYTLYYRQPEGQRGFRRVRVELAPDVQRQHPAARLRTRQGYYSE